MYDYQFSTKITEIFDVKRYWEQNITGKGVKVAIFDTGIAEDFASTQNNIKEIRNFTNENYGANDFNGHGTFVTSIIGGNNMDCSGLAPDVDFYILKVFTKSQGIITLNSLL